MAGILNRGLDLIEASFFSVRSRLSIWVNRLWQAGLYALGLLHWGYFLNWGKIAFDRHDWPQVGTYYYFLRQAILTGQLPLHISSTLITTDRYLGRPDTLLSPQALLLYFFQPGPFTLINTWFLFTVGSVGLLLIQKRYRLSPVVFTILFVLYNFNGHITAHMAVGHAMWTGYFLLPFFLLLVFQLVEQEVSWKWVLLTSLVLFSFLLQGAFHFFLWCLIFLLALGLFSPRHFLLAVKAIVFSSLLSLVRILPPAFEYVGGGPKFISGFISVTDLMAALVVLKHPESALSGPFKELGYWEVDTYLGLLGFAILVYFGVYLAWRKQSRLRALFAPACVLTFLSVGRVYELITRLPIPWLDSERVPARFLILPVTILIVLGSIQLQEYLNNKGKLTWREALLYFGMLILLGHDLLQHSRIWRLTNMDQLFASTPVDIRAAVINHPDPPYWSALIIGLTGSLITLIFLCVMVYRECHKKVRIPG